MVSSCAALIYGSAREQPVSGSGVCLGHRFFRFDPGGLSHRSTIFRSGYAGDQASPDGVRAMMVRPIPRVIGGVVCSQALGGARRIFFKLRHAISYILCVV